MWTLNIGYWSLLCFCGNCSIFLYTYTIQDPFGLLPKFWGSAFWSPFNYFCLINLFIKYYYRSGFKYDVAIRSTLLGYGFSTGIYLYSFSDFTTWRVFGLYLTVLTFFHYSEFFAIALTNPETLSIDSFILNHSLEYGVALIGSWCEYLIESYFYPDLKLYYGISLIGFIICLAGEALRKAAMFTAKQNFNHKVQYTKQPNHQLVTDGIYSWSRHPSYVGWFYWSIGTQIILLNPICLILYTIVSWSFFNQRVYYEEAALLHFFGPQYEDYQKRVSTGLPFIKGYSL